MFINFINGLLIFILGLCIGSFLNCVIYRLEQKKSLKGRSFCPHCKHTLGWLDLTPVFSFLFLRGKCRYCHKKISIQYPLVEIATGLIFLLLNSAGLQRAATSGSIFKFSILQHYTTNFAGAKFVVYLNFVFFFAFLFYIASALIIIFVYDLKHYLIPDKILFPAIIIAFLYRLFENLVVLNWVLNSNFKLTLQGASNQISNYLIAAIVASGFFFVIWLVSGGRWMGFGDVKLAVLMGLVLGFPNILVGLFLAFFFGAIIGTILVVLNKKELTPLEVKRSQGESFKNRLLTGLKSEIPFGPFLIAGTFIALFWSQQLIQWYLNLLRV